MTTIRIYLRAYLLRLLPTTVLYWMLSPRICHAIQIQIVRLAATCVADLFLVIVPAAICVALSILAHEGLLLLVGVRCRPIAVLVKTALSDVAELSKEVLDLVLVILQ